VSDQFDLGSMLAQAMEMQQRYDRARGEAAAMEVTGRAGGGAVEITVTGGLQFLDVTIAPEAVDPDDVEMLEDLVMAALIDATTQIDAMQQEMLGEFAAPDLGGLEGLGGLGDLGDLNGLAGILGEPGEPDADPDNLA
jgi:DNA-binding YbaB/EbfC family protein